MLGDYQEAEQCYREIVVIHRRQQDKTAIGQTLVNLGNLQAEAGRPDRAKAYYLEALDILEPLQDRRALGILYSTLALDEAAAGSTDLAIVNFTNSLELARAV